MDALTVLRFLQSQRFAVEATVSGDAPQAAVVGFAISDGFEIVFDALEAARKTSNLRSNARIALVVGGLEPGDERNVQYEGIADEPTGVELERVKKIYYGVFSDGRARAAWPGLIYFRVRPTWLRYSDYNPNPPKIVELRGDDFEGWRRNER